MKIDTLGVQAFIAVADHGSFNRAAESLHISQAALSRRVQNLEGFLGLHLIERTTRSVSLTRVGQDFLPQARRLLTDLASALLEIRESGKAFRGDVTIACVPTVGVQYLPGVVQRYAALHPQNRLRILDHSSSGVAAAVLRREAEFGINMQLAGHPELTSIPLLEDHMVLVCRADHALGRKRRLSWKQLEPYPVIVPGSESGNRAHLDMALERHKVKLQAFYEVQRSSTAVGMVAKGVGIAVVPALAVQGDAYPELRMIPLVDPVVSRRIVLVSRTNGQLTPAAQALYDLIRRQPSAPGNRAARSPRGKAAANPRSP